MPFHGYGYNCENQVCELDCDNPHCHPRDHQSTASYHPRFETSASNSSNQPVATIHKSIERDEREEEDPAQSRGVQPSLAAGGGVDLSRVPGMEVTNRGTFSFGGRRMGALSVGEMAAEVQQLAEARWAAEAQRRSADAMLAYPTPQDETERASRSAQRLQRATTAEEDFTRSARLAQESRADQAAREREREPRTLPDRMNRMYRDHLQHIAREAQARTAEAERERNRAFREIAAKAREDSVARWAEIQARMERLPHAVSTRNQEVTRDETPEAVPETKRISLTTRTSELPPIHEHTPFCIHESNGVANENTPIGTVNSSPDIEIVGVMARNSSSEADDSSDFKRPPVRVYTGDSGFGAGEDDMSDLRRPSRVMTGDSAFIGGDSSRSQSRKRGEDTPEDESD